jgi:hypothetical protein
MPGPPAFNISRSRVVRFFIDVSLSILQAVP